MRRVAQVQYGQLSEEIQALLSGAGAFLSTSISVEDVNTGQKAIGTVTAGATVIFAGVSIGTEFDGGVSLTIGDIDAQGRLVVASSVNCALSGVYIFFPYVSYEEDTDISVFFTGTPTRGQGSVFVMSM